MKSTIFQDGGRPPFWNQSVHDKKKKKKIPTWVNTKHRLLGVKTPGIAMPVQLE